MHDVIDPPREGVLARWARLAVRRRWLVLTTWAAILVVLTVLWRLFGGGFATGFTIPGTESQQAFDLLEARFPQQAGDSATLVFKAADGRSISEDRPRIESILDEAGALPSVIGVGSPFVPGGGAVSRDGRIAYATVQYGERANAIPKRDIDALLNLTERAAGDGLVIEAGGQVVQSNEIEPPGTSEVIGLVAAVFILLIAFGSVVAMGLPLATALVGLGASFALIGLGARVLDLPIFSSSFAAMIGIGVGIDYALFVVTRFREALHRGGSVEDAVAAAVSTAGRSVAFAGVVVVIALLGLIAIGIPFVGALGIAGAIVVTLAVLVALTLLPALLGFAGRSVDRWRIPIFHATDTGHQGSIWYRFSATIQRRPLAFFVAALAILLALSTPVLRMRLGSSDAGNGSTALHSRRAYDLLAEGFGPGFNGPLLVVFDLAAANGDAIERAEQVRTALAAWPGVAQVTPARPNEAGDAAVVTVIPHTSPQDAATQQLVHDLRTAAIPSAVGDTGLRAYVSGPTAAFIDIGDRISSRLPLFLGSVIGLSFLLLMAVFRSVVVPLKAAVMNLLSIGAAYGVVVVVFQWGAKAGPIESFLPMMLFAILFGLSMDYEVFLISRIREEYLRTGDNAESVAHGLAVTARVITAAAAIMVVVFLSFVLGPNRIIKEFGLGLATAIFVDATIVRLILVPAAMQLLGDANWWLPRWLDRLLPRLDVEGGTESKRAVLAAD